MKRGWISLLVILAIIIIGIAVYLSFFRISSCSDSECFKSSMINCQKIKYINDAPEAFWQYTILGSSAGNCKVEVKLLQLKQGSSDILSLEKQSMTCLIPLGVYLSPENEITRCNGRLKEEMQTIIITKLHNYILKNLGKISSDLSRAV